LWLSSSVPHRTQWTSSTQPHVANRSLVSSLLCNAKVYGNPLRTSCIVTSQSPPVHLLDTITGFLLARVGNVDLRRKTNYTIVNSNITVKHQIEDAFKIFTTREDIAIALISQYVANMMRFLVDSYNKPIPTILEIPSKDYPYDPAHDSILSRVKYFFSTE
ncbi:V-type proton ATPase subunit F-like, partial [Solanum pennellii]|uniref:V-type proton ATPase subunit F-like n=1 Tax=Solanum pennellii TaxID=28526 RepID=A0ABM1FQM5_SOLPN